ncbi:MAG: SDR family NAD(P)-dependent oxidoreductase [Spirochaetales bacterium]|nr:SDR family NAD(P)-dependent oxidoreductase [Spirochaetales bacterium]
MDEVVLVTGSESLTGRKLIEKLLSRGCRVVAPVAGKETEISETETPNLTVLTWNRSSWFSAKTILREIIRRNGKLDAAWIIHQAPTVNVPFSEASPSDAELILEQHIKGNVALVREVLPNLPSKGFLGFVRPHKAGTLGSLAAMSDGAFTSFATGVMNESGTRAWSAGFSNASPDAEGFTTALLSRWDERPKKLEKRWFRYTEGRRPFSGPSITDFPLRG